MSNDLETLKASIDQALAQRLPDTSVIAQPVVDAMRYGTLGGGKRLRPMFVCAACTGLGGELSHAVPAACALEFVHTYSLIHDDLPAMDNDDLRHGRAATHIEFGEANAILTGDALLTLAFEALATMPHATAEVRINCVRELAEAAGWQGMIGGQTFDMELAGVDAKNPSLSKLQALHAAKSGALIRASVQIGAIIAGADRETLVVLGEFADRVGPAFQIQDDVLDATASTEVLGKPAGSDEREQKQTFVRFMGVEGAAEQAEVLLEEALALLTRLPLNNHWLHDLAILAVRRNH